MPNINPEIIIPVRFEIRGKINGTSSSAFHVIGDFFNFNPTPAFDPQKLQVSLFCFKFYILHYCLRNCNDISNPNGKFSPAREELN